ncbi:hypothetical protein HPP92_010916 [Vanilla planifolia]|uniref:Uncharacterized protein n=1 Tax=Vanilla planifolia TaxID=51239 RepID=A0A835V086_VANPL|nr:hypothetical protein HPP92_010911 [Vanilla planifolia]KAG0480058.1 hypothetical protein HPP92_010916 [Vanilla planifolia]
MQKGNMKMGISVLTKAIFISQSPIQFLTPSHCMLLPCSMWHVETCCTIYNPVPKFVLIKSVVFLTYWQGVLVFLAAKSGLISNAEEAADLRTLFYVWKCLLQQLATCMLFPYKEYAGANIGGSSGLLGSLSHALKFNDFYLDTVHQFAPTYHEYVLYNNTEGEDGSRKYRSRTFVPTGQEMDTVRKNKHTYGGRLDELQLSSVSTSGSNSPVVTNASPEHPDLELIKSSLLKESSASAARPYDLSILLDTDLSKYNSKVPSVEESRKQ